MAIIKKNQAIIKFVGDRWVCTYKEKGERNFGYVGQGSNPAEAFSSMPKSGGIDKCVQFNITIQDEP